jgi:uncharacterized protein
MVHPVDATDFLLLPGRGNSNTDHWMSHWAGALPNSSRVLQADWDRPSPVDWIARLDAAIASAPRRVVLIGHSLAVATAVKWAADAAPDRLAKVAAALLVSPTDVENTDPSFDLVRPFAPMPRKPLPFPTLVLASRNDPRVTIARAREFAAAWGAELADVGELNHIGNAERLGPWPVGLLHLGQLLSRIAA